MNGKGMLDILDEYFVPMVKDDTRQERFQAAYGLMIDFLYDIQGVTDTEGFDVDDLDSLFDECMMEEFGYNYIVGDDYVCSNAEDAAEKVISLCRNKLSFDDVLERIEGLGCDDCTYINDICVSTQRNW